MHTQEEKEREEEKRNGMKWFPQLGLPLAVNRANKKFFVFWFCH